MTNKIEIEAEFSKGSEKMIIKGLLSRKRKGAFFKLPDGSGVKCSWLRIAGGGWCKHGRSGYIIRGLSPLNCRYGRIK